MNISNDNLLSLVFYKLASKTKLYQGVTKRCVFDCNFSNVEMFKYSFDCAVSNARVCVSLKLQHYQFVFKFASIR